MSGKKKLVSLYESDR